MHREGLPIARCTVQRLMRKLGLEGARRGKKVCTTRPDVARPCPLDLVNRQFTAQRPNQLWVADFTYVSTWQGQMFAAFVIDVYARRIVGWRVSSHMRTDFVVDALEQALYARHPSSAYSDEFRHRFQFKPTTPSDSNPQLFPIRFRHPTSMPSSEHHQRRVVHGGGRASLTTNARPQRWATRVQRAGCSCRPSPAPFSLNSILSRSESVISLPSSSCAWASSIRRPVRCGGRH